MINRQIAIVDHKQHKMRQHYSMKQVSGRKTRMKGSYFADIKGKFIKYFLPNIGNALLHRYASGY